MIETSPGHPALKELFEPDLPNNPALWAVLKGNYPGRAIVDQEESPAQCVLRTDAALSYFSQHVSQPFLDEALVRIRRMGQVWLVWPHRSARTPPDRAQTRVVERLEFDGCDPGSAALSRLRERLPEGCAVHSMDMEMLKRCEWRSEMEHYAGSLTSFLQHGIGLTLMRGEAIAAEAYASALGDGRAEIGALTRESERGKGYASIACAYLIQACDQRGYQAYWSCDAHHTASIRVAQKLGFQRSRAYQIYDYPALA